MEDMAERGEVEKVLIRLGAGGQDEQGRKLDHVTSKGTGKRTVLSSMSAADLPKGKGKGLWRWKMIKDPLVYESEEVSQTTPPHLVDFLDISKPATWAAEPPARRSRGRFS